MAAARLITRRDVIREAIARVRASLPRYAAAKNAGWWSDHAPRLAALDPETATKADVDAAAGNTSHTSLVCNGCGQDVDDAVQVGEGEVEDYESRTATLCRRCVAEAAALLAPASVAG
jgi:hypothetical protein